MHGTGPEVPFDHPNMVAQAVTSAILVKREGMLRNTTSASQASCIGERFLQAVVVLFVYGVYASGIGMSRRSHLPPCIRPLQGLFPYSTLAGGVSLAHWAAAGLVPQSTQGHGGAPPWPPRGLFPLGTVLRRAVPVTCWCSVPAIPAKRSQ